MQEKIDSLIVFAVGLFVLYVFYWHQERGIRTTGSIITALGILAIVFSFTATEALLIILFSVSGTIFMTMNFPIMKESGTRPAKLELKESDTEGEGH